MAEFLHQPSMAAGEISPDLYGRVDQELYSIGLKTARNFIIKQEGGANNRAGDRIVGEVKDSTKATRIINYKFNEEQTYILELGDKYMRVIVDGGQIVEAAKNITDITNANPAVVSSTAHGFLDGDDVFINGVVGMPEINGRSFRVANKSANSFELTDYQGNNINSSSFAAYVSSGTASRIYTVVTPWEEADLFELGKTELNDVVTMVHKNYYPRDITRTSNTAWTITQFDNSGGPFQDENITDTTVYASASTGTGITLTASASIFDATMVGELFRIEQEPTDTTASWEAQKPIYPGEIRRASTNYYKNSDASSAFSISGATGASPCVITTTAAHGLAQNDPVYITGVVGMTELNGKYFRVNAVTSSTSFSLREVTTTEAINSTSYTAYTSGGSVYKCKTTGTLKPDHTEGMSSDGSDGVTWEYLHSGFGIVKVKTYSSGTVITADVINRLPEKVVAVGNKTTIWNKSAWSEDQGYPFTTCHFKQRQLFGGTKKNTKRLDMSAVKDRFSFARGNPILDDEAISGSLDTGATIRHLVALSKLICLSDTTEELIAGDDNSFLASQPPTATVQGKTGSYTIPHIIIGTTAIFVGKNGKKIHSLGYNYTNDAFGGINLTARSPHLFKGRGKVIKDWAYQSDPNSIVWIVMSDGNLLSFTFMEEQKVYAFARHDTDGLYESVSTVVEDDEVATYFIVKRTINGVEKRYIERMASRIFDDIRDAFFVDCGTTYDGRNTGADTITVTGGTLWTSDTAEELTLTASSDLFNSEDATLNNEIAFWYENTDGINIRLPFNITGYISPTVVTAVAIKDVPIGYRDTARTDWEIARRKFYNQDHIEGKDVSVLADGNVVPDLSIFNGQVTIPDPSAVVHIGLPYTCQLETLDMANPQGQTKAKVLSVPMVHLTVQETREVFIGNNGFENVKPFNARGIGIGYDEAIPAENDTLTISTNTKWSRKGRICIQETNPLPITINCISPEVVLGDN